MAKSDKDDGQATLDARQSLLHAAAELFAQQGYSATGVQQITDAAGVNKAMLYYYFSSKEDLYDALIGEAVAAVEHAVIAAEQTDLPIKERLYCFISGYLSVVTDSSQLARILFREVMGGGECARQTVLDHFSNVLRRLEAVLTHAESAGDLRVIDANLLAYSLFGMATMYISGHFLADRPLDAPALADHIVDLFLNGAVAGSRKME